eukprot:m.22147 g.22147  ORF g.22147 m.22147 type:complete len:506 (-) comp13701_c0_seq1:40-1557(-)
MIMPPLRHPTLAEQLATQNKAMAGVTHARVSKLLQQHDMVLENVALVPDNNPDAPGRLYNNNAIFLVHAHTHTCSQQKPQRTTTNADTNSDTSIDSHIDSSTDTRMKTVIKVGNAARDFRPIQLILRIGNTHTWGTRRKTENEVAVLQWLAQHNVQLIPTIVAFSADASVSVLGCEFILMTKIPGVKLESVWNSCSATIKTSYKNQLKEWLGTLQTVPHPHPPTPNNHNNSDPSRIDHLTSFHFKQGSSQVLSSNPLAPFWLAPLPTNSCQGFATFTNAVINDCVARIQAEVCTTATSQHNVPPPLSSQQPSPSADTREATQTTATESNASRQRILAALKKVVAIVDEYARIYEPEGIVEPQYLGVRHNDLHLGNILCDPETSMLTGVVDWEGACWGLSDTDCEDFAHGVGDGHVSETLGFDFGSGLSIAPGVCERRKLMKLLDDLPEMFFFLATWYGGMKDEEKQAAVKADSISGAEGVEKILKSLFGINIAPPMMPPQTSTRT